jgi:hypothetical protein
VLSFLNFAAEALPPPLLQSTHPPMHITRLCRRFCILYAVFVSSLVRLCLFLFFIGCVSPHCVSMIRIHVFSCACVFFPGEYTEAKKQNEEAADDMDGFDADEEDDDEVDSDKEMGLDDEDGDEVSSLQLQKLAAEVCFSIFTDLEAIIYFSNAIPLI